MIFFVMILRIIYTHAKSASLLKNQTGGDCDFDIGNGLSQYEKDGEFVLAFDLPSW